MSWCYYMVLNDKKLLVDLGNKVSPEKFKEDLETIRDMYKFNQESPELDIMEIKVRDITIEQLSTIYSGYLLMTKLSDIRTSFVAIGMAISEDISVDNAEIIGEDKAYETKKYKGWVII